ncbi:MAG: hypothetical protein HN337_08960 [Deltaproteobacteria bacterium]|jgi:F0F1-type ATP synthase membrane subunit b/b'|nr:hypothetical protein [Deltaproteobacteria bacterium]
MKNLLAVLSVVALLTAISCSSIKNAAQNIISDDDKTIGQQLDEAGASLKDCRKNCTEAATSDMKAQCVKSCEYAEQMHKMAKEMTKGVSDKTQQEMAKDLQKKIYENMNQNQ